MAKSVNTSVIKIKLTDADVHKLGQELLANNGIIPDSWKPWLTILIAALTAAENEFGIIAKMVIEIIIAAINILEK
jgi:hypothetical protein